MVLFVSMDNRLALGLRELTRTLRLSVRRRKRLKSWQLQLVQPLHLHTIGWGVNLVLPKVHTLFLSQKTATLVKIRLVECLVAEILFVLMILNIHLLPFVHDFIDVAWADASLLEVEFPRGNLIMQSKSFRVR